MIAPPVVAALGIVSLGIKRTTVKATVLWGSFLIMVITVVPRIFDFGYLFFPAAIFLLNTALIQTRRLVVEQMAHHSLGNSQRGLVQ